MRSQKPLLVATFLLAWICITYFLWARQATIEFADDDYQKDLYRKLNQMEADVRREAQTTRELVQRLLAVVKGIDRVRGFVGVVWQSVAMAWIFILRI